MQSPPLQPLRCLTRVRRCFDRFRWLGKGLRRCMGQLKLRSSPKIVHQIWTIFFNIWLVKIEKYGIFRRRFRVSRQRWWIFDKSTGEGHGEWTSGIFHWGTCHSRHSQRMKKVRLVRRGIPGDFHVFIVFTAQEPLLFPQICSKPNFCCQFPLKSIHCWLAPRFQLTSPFFLELTFFHHCSAFPSPDIGAIYGYFRYLNMAHMAQNMVPGTSILGSWNSHSTGGFLVLWLPHWFFPISPIFRGFWGTSMT